MSTFAQLDEPENHNHQSSHKRHRTNDEGRARKRARSSSPGGWSNPRRGQHLNGASDLRSRRYRRQALSRDHTRSDSYRPNSQPQIPDQQAVSHDVGSGAANQSQRKSKTKRDRKENPSSRIHSLRKLIERRSLPPPVQAEKERELASLLFEREKVKLRQMSKRNLERYHFVRFMEKQKAQRVMKKLQKWKAGGATKDDQGRDIEDRLKEAEVDLNYTIYAPLGEKYISIFAEQNKHGEHISKAAKYKGNWKLVKADEGRFLQPEQMDELEKSSMEAADVFEIFGNVPGGGGNEHNTPSVKPPMWYEVQAAMEQGQHKLSSLRDRQQHQQQHGGPDDKRNTSLVLALKNGRGGNKETMDWMEDDGEIDPADLDSDSDIDDVTMDVGGVGLDRPKHNNNRIDNENVREDDDQDMSDGDGGFFEKR